MVGDSDPRVSTDSSRFLLLVTDTLDVRVEGSDPESELTFAGDQS